MISKYLLFFTLLALICHTNNANTVASSGLLAAAHNLPHLATPHTEPAEIKARATAELIVNGYLDEADESSLTHLQKDGKTIKRMLAERGYQIQNKRLVNRFISYRARYTTLFQEFLHSTNEKEVSAAHVTAAINNLKEKNPHLLRAPLTIYDIGCGDGTFSAHVVKALSAHMPNGTRDIHVSGIDKQKAHVQSTNILMSELNVTSATVTQGNFKDDPLETLPKDSANFMLASHVCYTFPEMDECINRALRIARQNTPIIFLHVSDSPINEYCAKFPHLLHDSTQYNAAKDIERSLKKMAIPYRSSRLEAHVQFPVISNTEWQQLNDVTYAQFDADYSAYGTNFIRAKNLLEFYLVSPLEGFLPAHRTLLLEQFKEMLIAHSYRIPIISTMQVAILNHKDTP